MNTETLHLFIEVAHRLSFAAVAEERGVDPSSVSRAIAQLEVELGLRLFQRSTRRMTLTEAGEQFRGRVAGILEALDEATDAARAQQAAPSGRLRISASVAFGEVALLPLIPDFRETYPEINLEIQLTDRNINMIAESVDLAIRLTDRLEGDLMAVKLMDTRYAVCLSPSYRQNNSAVEKPADLGSHRAITFTMTPYRTAWLFRDMAGAEERIEIKEALSISSALGVRQAAVAGLGPALLADWLIRDDLAQGRLLTVLNDYQVTATGFDTAAWLVYPTRSYIPRKTRIMIDFLKQHFKA